MPPPPSHSYLYVMAKQTEESLESLEARLIEIYGELEGLKFDAWYRGKKQIEVTGFERDVFTMFNVGHSKDAHDAVTTILDKLQKEQFNGESLYDITWKGITERGDGYYNLWIQEPQGDFKEEEQYSFEFDEPTVEIFRDVNWKKKYTAGVNIRITQV